MADEPKISNGERTDEALILAYRAGEKGTLDILFNRYFKALYYYLLDHSLIKEQSFLEDIRQDVFLVIFGIIKQGGFKPFGEGAFRGWLFTVALNICRTKNRQRAKQPIDIYGPMLDFIPSRPLSPSKEKTQEEARLVEKVRWLITKLTPEEQQLMAYLMQGKRYREILADPLFSKFTLDYLKHKICNTRKKLQEWMNGNPYKK